MKDAFGVVVHCTLARGKAAAVEELCEQEVLKVTPAEVPGCDEKAYGELVAAMHRIKQLELSHVGKWERDQDQPFSVIMAGLTLARHMTDDAEEQHDYFLKPDVSQLMVPIYPLKRDLLNPFVIEREICLQESLDAHVQRAAKKKGISRRVTLCGIGLAHLPRSDGVPVCVPTLSATDCELLKRLNQSQRCFSWYFHS